MTDSPRHDTSRVISGLYDELSGLPGPALFFDRVQQSLHLAEREGLSLAVVVLQLYLQGEDAERSAEDQAQIMATVARQVSQDTRISDTTGLLGEGQIGLLLPNVNPNALPVIIQRILEREPLMISSEFGEHEIPVRMGMTLRQSGETDVNSVMRGAWDRLDQSLRSNPVPGHEPADGDADAA